MTDSTEARRPFNVYLDYTQPLSLDSMEGVPAHAPVAPPLPGEASLAFDWQRRLHRLLDWIGSMSPGVVLAIVLAFAGSEVARHIGERLLGFEKSPLSPILVTVILGLLVRNIVGLPRGYEKGLRLCVKRILRIGVALLGLRLSLAAMGTIGLSALPIVIGCIVAALLVVTWLSRQVELSPRLGSLIAVGTSICGVSAIVATAPAIGADEEEVSYSVAVITLFGMTALFTYPFLAHWLFDGDAQLAGLFLGTAIHDTAQVAGAGLMYDLQYAAPETLDVATTTKLVRNVGMGLVIPLMAISYHRRQLQQGPAEVITPPDLKLALVEMEPVGPAVHAGLRRPRGHSIGGRPGGRQPAWPAGPGDVERVAGRGQGRGGVLPDHRHGRRRIGDQLLAVEGPRLETAGPDRRAAGRLRQRNTDLGPEGAPLKPTADSRRPHHQHHVAPPASAGR